MICPFPWIRTISASRLRYNAFFRSHQPFSNRSESKKSSHSGFIFSMKNPLHHYYMRVELGQDICFFSSASKCSFLSNPPLYPTILPDAPITLWQGTTMEKGFLFTAPPTARTAF